MPEGPVSCDQATAGVSLGQLACALLGEVLFAGGETPRGSEQTYLYAQWQPLAGADFVALLNQSLLSPQPRDANLARLARELALQPVETLAVVLALAGEEDAVMGQVIQHLQAPLPGSRPSLALLDTVLAPLLPHASVLWHLVSGQARALGLLHLLEHQRPLPEQLVGLPLPVLMALRGQRLPAPRLTEKLPLPTSTLARVEREARALAREPGVLVLRGASGHETLAVAARIAQALGRQLHSVPADSDACKGLDIACRLTGGMPLFDFTATAAQECRLPCLPAYAGPVLVATGLDSRVVCDHAPMAQWILPAPGVDERERLWRQGLGDASLARVLARRYIQGSGRIAQLAQLARYRARAAGRDVVSETDVEQAAWELGAGAFTKLAQPVTERVSDEALVLAPALRQALEHLAWRCEYREDLTQDLGTALRARYQPGVRCLLTGPSGTGKTLAAAWLATRLRLPLYRVDLAAVVSKYIGETEKNLAELLAWAEHAGVILLFDEADALFGKRTDIKEANDRFANSQINYLLQRLECYAGIVVLTSNGRERFDAAFTRRLDKIIEFALPAPQERRALWLTHLGEAHGLSASQINQLAVLCDLAGGHIRNVVLDAAVLARQRGGAIDMRLITHALAAEYRKLGRQMPVELGS